MATDTALRSCPGCVTAARVSRATGGGYAVCAWCAAEISDPRVSREPPEPRARPQAPPFEMRPERYGPPERRPAPRAIADLEVLSRWLPVLLGRAAGLERGIVSGRVPTTRPDHVDDQHHALDAASATLARLEALYASGDDGRCAVVVLWGAYVRGDLDGEAAGLLLAERAVRRAWLRSDKAGLRHQLPRTEGEALVKAARELYEDGALTHGAAPGWLLAVREDLDRRTHELLADLADDAERRRRAYEAKVLARKRASAPPEHVGPPALPPEPAMRSVMRRLLAEHDWDVASAARACGYEHPWTLALDIARLGLGAEVVEAWEHNSTATCT